MRKGKVYLADMQGQIPFCTCFYGVSDYAGQFRALVPCLKNKPGAVWHPPSGVAGADVVSNLQQYSAERFAGWLQHRNWA